VQLTLRIPSRQRFAAYDRKGHLAAGDPEADFSVEDHWVFERTLHKKDPSAAWRVAGRLSLAVQGK
jgi:predicted lipid-binding transport protein (Tim44 family)